MFCPRCGAANRDTNEYCTECGSELLPLDQGRPSDEEALPDEGGPPRYGYPPDEDYPNGDTYRNGYGYRDDQGQREETGLGYAGARGARLAAGYAGFWKRFAANFIDGIILNVVMAVVGSVAGIPWRSMYGTQMNDIASSRLATYSVISAVVGWLYFTLLESSAGQATLGKRALGIVVTDLGGRRISFARANARFWSKIISAAILMIGYLMAAFTLRKQALHDMIAGTLVVNRRQG